MADLQNALDLAQSQSVQVYQRKVQIAEQLQQLQMASQQCDAEFLRLDGEIRVLTRLVAETPKPQDAQTTPQQPIGPIAVVRRGRKPREAVNG